jgi:peptide/nickel transport system ATP-binding protein
MLGLPTPDVRRLLEQVQLGPHVLAMRPRQLSGGERQRVAIARALSSEPEFLVCDEITSALDVSIQASVIELLQQLQADRGIGVLFVTHNLPLVAAIADEVIVMQHGSVVEHGPVAGVIRRPATDYARELIGAVPARPTQTH